MIEKQKLITDTRFFDGLSRRNLDLLAGACRPVDVSKQDVLFQEDSVGDAVYVLASGAVGLYKTAPDGRQVLVKIIPPGELFAEVVLFERDTYPVTAIALRKSRVYVLPKTQFLRLLDDSPFRNDFIVTLMRKQRYLADRIRFLTISDAEERLRQFLTERFGKSEKIDLPFPKKDLAALLGVSAETLSRLLMKLKKRRLLRAEGRRLVFQKEYWAGR